MSQTAAAVPLCLPQLTHVGSTVNNDNLLILLGGVLAVLLAGVTTGDRRWTTAIGVGLLAGAALLTKAFGLAFLPWIVAAYAAPLLRDRGSRRSALRPAATRALAAVAVAVATGGWWMLRNVVRHGEPSPSVLDPYLTNAPEGFDPDFVWYGRHAVATIAQRFWGAFGYYEAALPTWSVVVVSALLGAVLGAAFLRTRQNQDPSPLGRRALFAYGSVLITTLGLVLYRAGSLYVQGGQTPALQGRYMFGAVVVLAVVAGRGAARLAGRRATVATFAAGVLLQAAALHVTLVTWWAEPDASLARSLRAMVRWSPWPDAAVVVLLAAIVAVVIRCAQVLWRSSVDPSPA